MRGSEIFELYGYPVDNWTKEAEDNLRKCHCPFMGCECDGGGNRFSSSIQLDEKNPLKKYFPNKDRIQAGVCSIRLHQNEQPWIVCPRRLLCYRSGVQSPGQSCVREMLYQKAGLQAGVHYSVWSEVKMKCRVASGDKAGVFDYTFDYVIAARGRQSIAAIAELFGIAPEIAIKRLEAGGFTISQRDGAFYCDDFPILPLVIVEVMTSSTCGGNKRKGTQISQVFSDTVRQLHGEQGLNPGGPAINYRQVWARMVSQLLVKSQVGKAWDGVTYWVLQDLLCDYISKTTALNLADFEAIRQNEVNIIAGGYGDSAYAERRSSELADIKDVIFYSGKVSADEASKKSFSDIVKLGVVPPVSELYWRLVLKKPCADFVL